MIFTFTSKLDTQPAPELTHLNSSANYPANSRASRKRVNNTSTIVERWDLRVAVAEFISYPQTLH